MLVRFATNYHGSWANRDVIPSCQGDKPARRPEHSISPDPRDEDDEDQTARIHCGLIHNRPSQETKMPDIEDVLADAQREIKAIGDNVKSLKETTDKSLADVRKLVEDAPKSLAGSDQFKKDVEALVAGVVEKHDAIATKVKQLTDGALKGAADRMDEIEKKLNRGKLGAGWGDTDEGTKAAKAFARDAKAIRHELKADFDPDKADLEEVLLQCVPGLPAQG
jgi:hypothetical protein